MAKHALNRNEASSFADRAREARLKKLAAATGGGEEGYKNLQVRLKADEAKALIRLAEDNGFKTVQDVLVAALDRLRFDWGQTTPLHNPGAKKVEKPVGADPAE